MKFRTCAHCGRAIPPQIGVVVLDVVAPDVTYGADIEIDFVRIIGADGSMPIDPIFIMNTDEDDAGETYPGIPCGDPHDAHDEVPLAYCWGIIWEDLIEDLSEEDLSHTPGVVACDFCGEGIAEGCPCVRVRHGYLVEHKTDLRFEEEGIDVMCAACATRVQHIWELWGEDSAALEQALVP